MDARVAAIIGVMCSIVGVIMLLYGNFNNIELLARLGSILAFGSVFISPAICICLSAFRANHTIKNARPNVLAKIKKQKKLPIYSSPISIWVIIAILILGANVVIGKMNHNNIFYSIFICISFFTLFAVRTFSMSKIPYKPFELYSKFNMDSNFFVTFLEKDSIPEIIKSFSKKICPSFSSNASHTAKKILLHNAPYIEENLSEFANIYFKGETILFANMIISQRNEGKTFHTNMISCRLVYEGKKERDIMLSSGFFDYDLENTNEIRNNCIGTRFSNLRPFFTNNIENNQKIIHIIAPICSNFFAKTRIGYSLEITEQNIELTLSYAKLGEHYRFFNNRKTARKIQEATYEICYFLIDLKNALENYDNFNNF